MTISQLLTDESTRWYRINSRIAVLQSLAEKVDDTAFDVALGVEGRRVVMGELVVVRASGEAVILLFLLRADVGIGATSAAENAERAGGGVLLVVRVAATSVSKK